MTNSEPPSADMVLHRELCGEAVGAFYEVYSELGTGFLESAYQRAMQIALIDRGLRCEREVPARVHFRGHLIGEYRMDLLVNETIIVECKIAEKITMANHAQLLNYLRATDFRVGIILNFGKSPSFKRLVYDTIRGR